MNTCSQTQTEKASGHGLTPIAGLLVVLLLTACASSPPPAPPPTRIVAQRLLLDAPNGGHELVAANSAAAQTLAAAFPGRLIRLPIAAPGVLSLNNVSIPLALGAAAPAATSLPNAQESSP